MRHTRLRLLRSSQCFNPRTHAGCDKVASTTDDGNLWFQSTHPRGVRLERPVITISSFYRFNPRTHAGCDRKPKSHSKLLQVSIHAPTRGATGDGFTGKDIKRSFNPRTHAGCDMENAESLLSVCCFNPRTHAGCDQICLTKSRCRFVFQSTHPRGVRPSLPVVGGTIACFNPRTHAGCDGQLGVAPIQFQVSIHAPTRGATSCLPALPCSILFQSTHPRGVRPT